MATAKAQAKWRAKNRFVKSQLNVMARRIVHDDLAQISDEFALRGKGEAVSFAADVTKGLIQHAAHNEEARRLLRVFAETFQARPVDNPNNTHNVYYGKCRISQEGACGVSRPAASMPAARQAARTFLMKASTS